VTRLHLCLLDRLEVYPRVKTISLAQYVAARVAISPIFKLKKEVTFAKCDQQVLEKCLMNLDMQGLLMSEESRPNDSKKG
jgi:hypothetical protein